MKRARQAVAAFAMMSALGACTSTQDAYLFSSFRGDGEDGLHLAWSGDGLTWTALKGDQSFLLPDVGGKLMRDPCIIRGPDGVYHMVWTTGWWENNIGIAHSRDLIHWSAQQEVPDCCSGITRIHWRSSRAVRSGRSPGSPHRTDHWSVWWHCPGRYTDR